MNDQELATAVRQSVDGARLDIPEEQILARSRAIRAARRRRVAAAVIAIVTAGAASAAAIVIPGSAAPAVQDTAYVVSHVTQALDSVPAGTILFLQSARTGPGSVVTDWWGRGLADRTEEFRAGQLVSESGSAVTGTTRTAVYVNYQYRIWSRSAGHLIPPSAAARAAARARNAAMPACDSANPGFGIPDNASMMAASLRDWVSCNWLKADGTAPIGGVTAIRLTRPTTGSITSTWYVSPATYLPIRETVTRQGTLRAQLDFQWLPPTTANLAKLNLPAVPPGFTRESGAACNRSPGC
jgi:hypothetical protein